MKNIAIISAADDDLVPAFNNLRHRDLGHALKAFGLEVVDTHGRYRNREGELQTERTWVVDLEGGDLDVKVMFLRHMALAFRQDWFMTTNDDSWSTAHASDGSFEHMGRLVALPKNVCAAEADRPYTDINGLIWVTEDNNDIVEEEPVDTRTAFERRLDEDANKARTYNFWGQS